MPATPSSSSPSPVSGSSAAIKSLSASLTPGCCSAPVPDARAEFIDSSLHHFVGGRRRDGHGGFGVRRKVGFVKQMREGNDGFLLRTERGWRLGRHGASGENEQLCLGHPASPGGSGHVARIRGAYGAHPRGIHGRALNATACSKRSPCRRYQTVPSWLFPCRSAPPPSQPIRVMRCLRRWTHACFYSFRHPDAYCSIRGRSKRENLTSADWSAADFPFH